MLYEGLEDRIFDVPGNWDLRRCSNPTCRHVWLDPQPIEADLPLLYEEYYTHGTAAEETHPLTAVRLLRRLFRFGYEAFVRVSGLARERQASFEMYLGNRPPGRLLEIGCGSGERLAHFAAKGWTVQGQDVDAKAVAHARATTGLPVHLGPIGSLPRSAGPFDAVVMSHVIEHVPDPVVLLRQARGLMAAGGVLIAVTPNIESVGHRWFNANWRGLEPPRHLHLFSPDTLQSAAQAAGFRQARVKTSAVHAEDLIGASLEIERAGRVRMTNPGAPSPKARIQMILLQLTATIRHRFDPGCGEECVLMAEANSGTQQANQTHDRDNSRRQGCGGR